MPVLKINVFQLDGSLKSLLEGQCSQSSQTSSGIFFKCAFWFCGLVVNLESLTSFQVVTMLLVHEPHLEQGGLIDSVLLQLRTGSSSYSETCPAHKTSQWQSRTCKPRLDPHSKKLHGFRSEEGFSVLVLQSPSSHKNELIITILTICHQG